LPFVPDQLRRRILQRYYLSKVRLYQRQEWRETTESDLQVIKHLVRPGDDVIDVGANFGFYTVYMSELVGPDGSVSSFEPIGRTFDLLAYNVTKLSLGNVRLFNCAVSDQDGSATMGIPQFDSGNENYYQARLAGAELLQSFSRQVPVQLKKLDSVFLGDSRKLTFIKIDVEGHELHAINGARRLISTFKPALLIEMSGNLDDHSSAAFMLARQLQEDGYSPYWYDGMELRLRAKGDDSINYFFLTSGQLHGLDSKVRCTAH
jgi:FkbM family methyltransferase